MKFLVIAVFTALVACAVASPLPDNVTGTAKNLVNVLEDGADNGSDKAAASINSARIAIDKSLGHGAQILGQEISVKSRDFKTEADRLGNTASSLGRKANQWFNGNNNPYPQYIQPIANWFQSYFN